MRCHNRARCRAEVESCLNKSVNIRGCSAIAMEANQVKIELVTKWPDGGCTLVLVEIGPWTAEQKNQNMQRLGNRIASCVSAVINDHVAQRYREIVINRMPVSSLTGAIESADAAGRP